MPLFLSNLKSFWKLHVSAKCLEVICNWCKLLQFWSHDNLHQVGILPLRSDGEKMKLNSRFNYLDGPHLTISAVLSSKQDDWDLIPPQFESDSTSLPCTALQLGKCWMYRDGRIRHNVPLERNKARGGQWMSKSNKGHWGLNPARRLDFCISQ